MRISGFTVFPAAAAATVKGRIEFSQTAVDRFRRGELGPCFSSWYQAGVVVCLMGLFLLEVFPLFLRVLEVFEAFQLVVGIKTD